MKQFNYILIILSSLCFGACSKEEITGNSEPEQDKHYYINPEDTAGIVVPEGYTLVLFPGSDGRTKASTDTRISHLQYLVYQENEAGEYIQYIPNTQVTGDLTTWPLRTVALPLPENTNFRIVFLGNIDKSIFGNGQSTELLSGTGINTNYTSARILMPRKEFSNTTMYYFANETFNSGTITQYIPITLKRIVSRNDIIREGLTSKYAPKSTLDDVYKSAYWNQLIREKLKEFVFTGQNSVFRYQYAEVLKKEFIYPLIYIGLKTPGDAILQAANFTAVNWYVTEGIAYAPSNPVSTDLFDQARTTYYANYVTSTYTNNIFICLAQYIYDTFVETNSKDPEVLSEALNQIYTDNIKIAEKQGAVTDSIPSTDGAIAKLVKAFNDKYTGNLLPWRNRNDAKAAIVNITSRIPSTVNFDLEVTNHEEPGSKYYLFQKALDTISDKYISIITLGNPATNSNRFEISGISSTANLGGLNIDYSNATPNGELLNGPYACGYFHRNEQHVSTLSITNVSLKNPKQLMTDNAYKQQMEIKFYNVFLKMNATNSGATGKYQVTIGRAHPFTVAISYISANEVSNILKNIQSMQYTKYNDPSLYSYDEISYPSITFVCPDISDSNLIYTFQWTTRNKYDNSVIP